MTPAQHRAKLFNWALYRIEGISSSIHTLYCNLPMDEADKSEMWRHAKAIRDHLKSMRDIVIKSHQQKIKETKQCN